VLVVTIDTLRADHLGIYGNPAVATPNMDRWGREGAIALNATVHAPLTRPSHISIFTGLYPAQHGIRDNISRALAPDVPTLAEAFKAAGFKTAGFVSSIVLSAQSGLGRGFDDFSDRFELGADTADEARFLDILERRGDVTTAEAVAWLEAHANDRTFTWVHLYDPHLPYEAPEPFGSRYADRPYDGEVAWSDELVGRLDAALTQSGIRDQTLIVLTSDHGEGLGDHEETVHGFFVYESTLRVPLIVRGAGIAPGTRIAAVVRSIDLFPTVLDLMGIPARRTDPPLPGRSLAGALRGRSPALDEQPAFAESLTPRIHYGWSDLHSVRDGRWKYILAPRPELYDLSRDPGEGTNLADANPVQARALRAGLERHIRETNGAAIPKAGAADVPPEVLEKLGALGYVDAGGGPERASTDADPKDKVQEYKILNSLLHEGLINLRAKDYPASVDRFRELARRGIDSFEAHYYFGQALVGLKRWREAAAQFERAIPRLPGFAASYLALADCRTAAGDPKGAIAALRAGERAVPSDPRLYEREGAIWQRLGNTAEAIRAYTAELRYAEKDPVVRARLAGVHRDAGDLQNAEKYFREAIALDAADAEYRNSLGMVLGARGDLAEAERAFHEAIQRDAREPRYTYNLGLTLQREGHAADAAAAFRKTLDLDPRFAAARERLRELDR
jgi:arylsulfatase A-like enzyme/tetratricopeptide (TPR) repeat protein